MKDDNEARAFTSGAMLMFGFGIYAFYPITVFPVVEAPRWKKGYSVNLAFVLTCWALFLLGTFLHRRDTKKAEQEQIHRDEEKLGHPEHAEATIKE